MSTGYRRRLSARYRRVAGLLGVVLCATVAGCGIPGETGVQVEGRGPGPGQGLDENAATPPRYTDRLTPEKLVRNYLLAAAGESGDLAQRIHGYIGPETKKLEVGDASEINIIRLIGDPVVNPETTGAQQTSEVTVRVQQIGVLGPDGIIGPPQRTEQAYEFTVGPKPKDSGQNRGSSGPYLLDLPPLLLLDERALADYYRQHTVYFWNADRSALVPDLRHLPRTVPRHRQATEVLAWLTGGPAKWLTPAATGLPEGTKANGNVPDPQRNDQLEVDLQVPAEVANNEDRLDDLVTQLAWSLPSQDPQASVPSRLELKIQGKTRRTVQIEQIRTSTAEPLYPVPGPPARFCVYDGRIHAFGPITAQARVPLLPEANQQVISAGLARDWSGSVWAALVVPGDRDDMRLRTAIGRNPLGPDDFAISGRSFGTISRPLWLKTSDPEDPIGLVVADGSLYQFDRHAVLEDVVLPRTWQGKVTAAAVALDGQRIALVFDGRQLVVAPLLRNGDRLVLGGDRRRLPTTLTDLTAVDWNGETSLVLAGNDGNEVGVIYRLAVDGSGQGPESGAVDDAIVHLAAYPVNPTVRASPFGNVLSGTRGRGYADEKPIDLSELALPVDGPTPTVPVEPTAPFFLY